MGGNERERDAHQGTPKKKQNTKHKKLRRERGGVTWLNGVNLKAMVEWITRTYNYFEIHFHFTAPTEREGVSVYDKFRLCTI